MTNQQAQVQDRIIEKIKKLLAVANSNATGNGVEHEQETAMRQAHAMLAKHNLQMADIFDDKEDRDVVEIAEEFPCPWRRVVAGALARLYFCTFYWEQVPNKQKYKFCFVGLESNATTAMEMTKFLLKSILQESEKQRKAKGEVTGWGTSFRNAAGTRISARCSTIRAEAEADPTLNLPAPTTSDSTALTIVSVYKNEEEANDAFIEKILGLNLRTKKIGGKLLDRDGAVAGDAYGRKVNLGTQIGSSKNTAVAALPA